MQRPLNPGKAKSWDVVDHGLEPKLLKDNENPDSDG